MSKREKKPKSKVRKILEWVGFGLIGAVFVFAMIAQIDAWTHKDENWGQQLRFGYGSFVVQTDSMEPEYKVKSAIITYKKDPTEIYNQFISNPDTPIDITFSYQSFASFVPDDKTLTKQTNISGYDKLYGTPMTHRVREIHVDTSVEVGKGRYIFVVAGINPESSWASNQYQVFSEQYILGVVTMNSQALGAVFSFIASPWGLFGLLLIPAFYLVISSTIDIFKTLKEPEEATSGAGSGGGTVSSIADSDRERLKQEMLMQMLEEKRKAKAAANAEVASKEEKPANPDESPAETLAKKESSEALSGYDDEQKKALRQQMLAQIMAERAQGKEIPKPAEKESSKALEGYDEEQKKALRQQMLAQIMAEKKAAKQEKEEPVKKEDDNDGQA